MAPKQKTKPELPLHLHAPPSPIPHPARLHLKSSGPERLTEAESPVTPQCSPGAGLIPPPNSFVPLALSSPCVLVLSGPLGLGLGLIRRGPCQAPHPRTPGWSQMRSSPEICMLGGSSGLWFASVHLEETGFRSAEGQDSCPFRFFSGRSKPWLTPHEHLAWESRSEPQKSGRLKNMGKDRHCGAGAHQPPWEDARLPLPRRAHDLEPGLAIMSSLTLRTLRTSKGNEYRGQPNTLQILSQDICTSAPER